MRYRLATAALAAVGLIVAVPTAATAQPAAPATTPTTTGPTTTTPTTTAPGTPTTVPGTKQYPTLGAAMLGFYATSSGQSVTDFASRNSSLLSLFGTDATTLAASYGVGAPAWSSDDVRDLLGDSAAAPTIDSALVADGASWATSLGDSFASGPALGPMPTIAGRTPSVNTAAATRVPPEALAFGLLLNRSVTALVTDFPNIYASARSGGLGTAAGDQAWRTSMLNAFNSTQGDLTKLFPSPCSGALLGAMASGTAAGGLATGGTNCGACVTAGLYMSDRMAGLFDFNAGSTLLSQGGTAVPPADWSTLPQWQRDVVTSQNPSLRSQLSSTLGSPTGNCAASSAAVAGGAATVLPGVFANLGR